MTDPEVATRHIDTQTGWLPSISLIHPSKALPQRFVNGAKINQRLANEILILAPKTIARASLLDGKGENAYSPFPDRREL